MGGTKGPEKIDGLFSEKDCRNGIVGGVVDRQSVLPSALLSLLVHTLELGPGAAAVVLSG